MAITQKTMGTALLYLITIALGIWLSHAGHPLSPALSAAHKLIALAAVAATALLFLGSGKSVPSVPMMIPLLAVEGALVVTLIATGAVMSGAKNVNGTLLLVHNLATVLTVLGLAGAVYLATRKLN